MPSCSATTCRPSGLLPSLALTASATLLAGYWYHRHRIRQLERNWDTVRRSERTGRIRAECRLRALEKQLGDTESSPHQQSANRRFTASIIGHVTSPYTKRMGTPRQPQLVPASRGYIQFTVPSATLDGIQHYSHVWVLFVFHANTNLKSSRKTKIRPPRANGIKLGQLATRSPHRPNPIGLSLCEVAQWNPDKQQLFLRGLDLVHGTPVLDIKPCVPWDVPPTHNFRVPDWVQQEDSIATVDMTEQAREQLDTLVRLGKLEPLYTTGNDGYQGAVDTLAQVLAQDPRSSHRGLKTNARGTIGDSNANYSLIFGQTNVEFQVTSEGVTVVRVSAANLDEATYVDGLPLLAAMDCD